MRGVPQSNRSFVDHIEAKDRQKNRKFRLVLILVAIFLVFLVGIIAIYIINNRIKHSNTEPDVQYNIVKIERPPVNLTEIPKYDGAPYCELNDNIPWIETDGIDVSKGFESYSDLDNMGRCGTAYANLCTELMPTEERGEIGMVKPSGWHTVKYPDIIDDLYLYNRCHLIAYSLSGENANELNLITGTRYFNVEGMLPFENSVRKYIDDTGNHVLYRVTPLFDGSDLISRGVVMEAISIEDKGRGVKFNVFVYNVQPGIIIDYSNGDSMIEN